MWQDVELERVIEEQRVRRGGMDCRDVYKLLYQGVLGPEHLVTSVGEFTARLREEYAAVPAAEDDPLWEAVRPDGTLGRVNLRPFRARGGRPEWLIDACLRTAARPWGAVEELRATWEAFVALCWDGRWEQQFPPAEAQAFTVWVEAQGWPAVHHSVAYREAYRPAYRLVAKSELCEGLGPSQSSF